MNSLHKRGDEQGRASGKKPYMTPKVQVYGDLREITRTLNLNMGNDGNPGNQPNSKTS